MTQFTLTRIRITVRAPLEWSDTTAEIALANLDPMLDKLHEAINKELLTIRGVIGLEVAIERD